MNSNSEAGHFRLVPILADGSVGTRDVAMPRDLLPALGTARAHYGRTGYLPPWIGYLAVFEGEAVGGGAFVGTPRDGTVEIAYFTLPARQRQGIAGRTARALRDLARDHDPSVVLTAKTMPEEGPSTRILARLGFRRTGDVEDHEIGMAWGWRLDP